MDFSNTLSPPLLTARQFFILVPEVGFSLEGQTRGSAPTGKAVV